MSAGRRTLMGTDRDGHGEGRGVSGIELARGETLRSAAPAERTSDAS